MISEWSAARRPRDSVGAVTLDLDALRPFPDTDDPELRAHDAADRLLLDESAAVRRASGGRTSWSSATRTALWPSRVRARRMTLRA